MARFFSPRCCRHVQAFVRPETDRHLSAGAAGRVYLGLAAGGCGAVGGARFLARDHSAVSVAGEPAAHAQVVPAFVGHFACGFF